MALEQLGYLRCHHMQETLGAALLVWVGFRFV
jgi:hypothetical protein